MKQEDDLIIYSVSSGYFSLEIEGIKSSTFYFKTNNNNIIVEFDKIITRMVGDTFISASFNIVNTDEQHKGEIELYHKDKLVRIIPYQYIPIEKKDIPHTDIFDIVPDKITLKSEEDRYIIVSETNANLMKNIRALVVSNWCSVSIIDNELIINVQDNPFKLPRKTKIKFFLDTVDTHKIDYTVVTQEGRAD